MALLKFLHIISMFGAVTLVFGSLVFMDLAGRMGDVVTYRRLDAVVQRTDLLAMALFLLGLVFGFLTAITGSFDLAAGWLVLAYILVLAIFIEGFVFTFPWYRRLRETAHDGDEARARVELQRLLHSGHHTALVAVVSLLWAGVIFVMVVKPDPF
jgi:hypothetical protein